ncbi:MAG: Mrp/NBP35 family ATP-binding protein [Acidimicrobiales bacterium]
MAHSLTDEDLRSALRGVVDPELGDNIVDLGMVRGVSVSSAGAVTVSVALTIAGCPLRAQLRRDVEARVSSLPGVASVEVLMGEMTATERSAVMERARWKAREDSAVAGSLPPSARVVAIASGKGGVGKSSVSVNLAVALAQRGYAVGLLDADIWGFSVPRMLGVRGRLSAEGTAEAWSIVPHTLGFGPGRLEVVSMGLLAESEDAAIMWRGLMLNRAVQHFVENVAWGELDYLLVDMPPGTGDVQMGLARMLPRTEVLIVTTPPVAAARVAARVADMARKGWLRVAGVIENMSGFTCEHGVTYELFGSGGGQSLADDIGAPLLGSVPFDPSVAAGGDAGRPAVLGDGPVADAFASIVDRILSEAIPPFEVGAEEMSGCTARMLDAMEAAAGALPAS